MREGSVDGQCLGSGEHRVLFQGVEEGRDGLGNPPVEKRPKVVLQLFWQWLAGEVPDHRAEFELVVKCQAVVDRTDSAVVRIAAV